MFTRYEDRTFTNQEVVLDGNEYYRCRFIACNFTFEGGEWAFVDCEIGAVGGLTFSSSAARTTRLLQLLWRSETGKRIVLSMLDPEHAPHGTRTFVLPCTAMSPLN